MCDNEATIAPITHHTFQIINQGRKKKWSSFIWIKYSISETEPTAMCTVISYISQLIWYNTTILLFEICADLTNWSVGLNISTRNWRFVKCECKTNAEARNTSVLTLWYWVLYTYNMQCDAQNGECHINIPALKQPSYAGGI